MGWKASHGDSPVLSHLQTSCCSTGIHFKMFVCIGGFLMDFSEELLWLWSYVNKAITNHYFFNIQQVQLPWRSDSNTMYHKHELFENRNKKMVISHRLILLSGLKLLQLWVSASLKPDSVNSVTCDNKPQCCWSVLIARCRNPATSSDAVLQQNLNSLTVVWNKQKNSFLHEHNTTSKCTMAVLLFFKHENSSVEGTVYSLENIISQGGPPQWRHFLD